jgi:hypothetical protein
MIPSLRGRLRRNGADGRGNPQVKRDVAHLTNGFHHLFQYVLKVCTYGSFGMTVICSNVILN